MKLGRGSGVGGRGLGDGEARASDDLRPPTRDPLECAIHRRDFVSMMCMGGLATFAAPLVRFAHVRQGGRFVFVLLRGGFDGLAAIVPYGDPSYEAIRGALAYERAVLTPLDGTFALAPGLAHLKEFWDRGELAVLHAMA